MHSNRCVGETGNELLDPAESLDTCNRRAKCRAIPKEEVQTKGEKGDEVELGGGGDKRNRKLTHN